MIKKVISIPNAPKLPYSPAIRAGDYIFVSGQFGSVDVGGNLIAGIEAQTERCLENIKQVLAAAGSSLDDVVKVTIFLRREEDFATMNRVYQRYFVTDQPARSTVVAGLALPDMLIEIDCIAYSPDEG